MKKQKRAWLFVLALVLAFLFDPVPVFAASVSSAASGPSGAVSIVNGYTAEQVEQILKQQQSSSSSASSAASSNPPASSRKTVSSGSSGTVSSEVSSGGSSDLSSGTAASEESSSSDISLPSVGSVPEDNPLSSVIVDTNANRQLNWIGIVSWACIALGILVVLVVVFSNRRPPKGGSGRSRYRKPNRSKRKHLLNDKYYRHTRY
jgi:hypothetical protein